MKKLLAALFVLALLLFYLASGSNAQTVQGVITGTVTDPSGAAVPDATITITHAGTGASLSTTTGTDGTYRFPLVPPGSYVIDIKSASFKEVRTTGIVVEASQTVPFNARLEIGTASQVVEVTSQVALVQTATSDLGIQVDRKTIENAPLVDRDVFSTLPFLAPQVQPGLNMNPASGGARESGTAYLLNGADDNDNFSEGAINVHPPLESVEDFSIMTNSMSAQYGRAAGAVVSANQKSGTNRFHGALYEFNRNASLNANDFFYSRDYYNSLGTDAPLPKRPKYIRNQFGGEVDGPIRKDKTFFSFAYDRIKLSAGSTTANTYVPTSDAVAYIQANGGPIANQILAARPPVTSNSGCPDGEGGTLPGTGQGTDYWGNGVPNPVGCLSFFDPQIDTENTYYGRVDHIFSPKDRISVTVNYYRQSFVDTYSGGPLTTNGPINSSTFNHFHNIALTENHVFSPRVVNELTIAHNRHFNVGQEGNGTADTLPNIYIDNQNGGCLAYQLGGDAEGGQIVGFTQDRWQVQDNLSWSIGRHSLKFGGGGQYGIFYRNWDLGLPGQYEFGELTTINGSGSVITPLNDGTLQPDGTIANIDSESNANFAGDYPYFQETSIDPSTGAKADAYRHYVYHDYYAFIQDDWKVSPRFTLNLGLRWDRFGAPSEVHGIVAQFTNLGCDILDPSCLSSLRMGPVSRMWPTQNKDFGPRFGFAWDVLGNGKMAVRGGYGISYDRIFDNIWSNGAWNPPFYALIDFSGDGGDSINYSNPNSIGVGYDPNGPNGPIPYPGKRVSLRSMDQNMKDSSAQNFYLGVEHSLGTDFLFRVNYQGSFGRHLPMLENYNRYDGDAYGVNGPTSLSAIPPNALYNGFNYRSNSVSSNYNALIAELQKRTSHGLQFQTSYTFSKLLDINSDLFAACSNIGGIVGTTAPYYYITNSQPGRLYGPGSFDHRHAYKFSVTYEFPFFKAQKGFVGHALGGWAVGSFFQYYYGHPVDVYNGRTRVAASTPIPFGGTRYNGTTCTKATGCADPVFDQNGIVYNIGGDYNLDGVANDHPDFVGSSIASFYNNGGASPADGFFADNSRIACGFAGMPTNIANSTGGSCAPAGVANAFFANPAYPSGSTPFERFGALGRDVFHGPSFKQLDVSLNKSFKLTERMKLDFRAQAQNVLNHPSFDCLITNLASSQFGKAQCLAQKYQALGLGNPISRVMSLGLRLAF
jgi:hypothetical protein